MRCTGQVARIGQRKNINPYRVLVSKSEEKRSRLKKSNKMQQYADIYLLVNYSTCFGRPSRPSSGVHKTVVADYGTAYLGNKLLQT